MTIITNEMTPNEKGQVTTAILEYMKAKAERDAADAVLRKRQAELLLAMGGQLKVDWEGGDKVFALTATYGKTRKTLSSDLVEKVLGVKVTDECYSVSKPWDELRIKVCG